MKSVVWVLAGFLVLWAGYEGWAYHERQVGKLEAAVADDVRVNRELTRKDVILSAYIPALRDSATRATATAVKIERRRTAFVAASDSAAALTDSVIHAAVDVASDATSKARLDSVAAVVARERVARGRERLASDSTIAFWKASDLLWHRAADSTGSLATVRKGRIDALERENAKIREMLPSKTGSALKLAGTVVATVLTCRYVVHCQ